MLKFMLPDRLWITLHPHVDVDAQRIELAYFIEGQPFLRWINDKVIMAMGGAISDSLEITPEKIIIKLPGHSLPYRLEDIDLGEITIILKKE